MTRDRNSLSGTGSHRMADSRFDFDRDLKLDPVAAYLGHAVSGGASAQRVAELIARTFQGIDQVLAPIIGQQGMEALFRRSLQLGDSICAQLHSSSTAVSIAVNLELLSTELARQTAAVAASAGSKLLHVFRGLLSSLIGPALTERLLSSLWVDFLSASPARTLNS